MPPANFGPPIPEQHILRAIENVGLPAELKYLVSTLEPGSVYQKAAMLKLKTVGEVGDFIDPATTDAPDTLNITTGVKDKTPENPGVPRVQQPFVQASPQPPPVTTDGQPALPAANGNLQQIITGILQGANQITPENATAPPNIGSLVTPAETPATQPSPDQGGIVDQGKAMLQQVLGYVPKDDEILAFFQGKPLSDRDKRIETAGQVDQENSVDPNITGPVDVSPPLTPEQVEVIANNRSKLPPGVVPRTPAPTPTSVAPEDTGFVDPDTAIGAEDLAVGGSADNLVGDEVRRLSGINKDGVEDPAMVFQYDLLPLGKAGVLNVTQGAVPPNDTVLAEETNKWMEFLGRPEVIAFFLQSGINMLQPRPNGQSQLAHIANSMGAGARAAGRVKTQAEASKRADTEEARKERETDIRGLALGIEEQKIASADTRSAAKIASDEKIAGQKLVVDMAKITDAAVRARVKHRLDVFKSNSGRATALAKIRAEKFFDEETPAQKRSITEIDAAIDKALGLGKSAPPAPPAPVDLSINPLLIPGKLSVESLKAMLDGAAKQQEMVERLKELGYKNPRGMVNEALNSIRGK